MRARSVCGFGFIQLNYPDVPRPVSGRQLTAISAERTVTGTSTGTERCRSMTESDQTRLDRIWDIVEKAGVCMMTTRFYGGMRARPMEARPDREEGVIWFLTDQRGLKDDEIDAIPEVCLIFVYPKERSICPSRAK
jgi:general stress protein 26